MAIPDFTTYTDNELLSIVDVQFRQYLEAYNALALASDNPAADAETDALANIQPEYLIEELALIAENSRKVSSVVAVQDTYNQDRFDYAEAFLLEWWNRFYDGGAGNDRVNFTAELQTVKYDGTDITVVVYTP